MTQTGILQVRMKDFSWRHVGFPNAAGGAFKVHDGERWHIADNNAIVRSGRLKVNIGGAWQHASWMRLPYVPVPLHFHGVTALDPFTTPAGILPLPLHANTQIGDLMVLSLSPSGWSMEDGRFRDYGNGAYIGRATTLAPVNLLRTTSFGFAQAVCATYDAGNAVVAGTGFATTEDSVHEAMPVIGGVNAAVYCAQGSFRTVAGWVLTDGTAWHDRPQASTSNNHATVGDWWSDELVGSAETTWYGDGGPGYRGMTVIGLIGVES